MGCAWCFSELRPGPLKSHARGRRSEHMEALEDLAGVMGYAGSGDTRITCPSVFLAVNWTDFFQPCTIRGLTCRPLDS